MDRLFISFKDSPLNYKIFKSEMEAKKYVYDNSNDHNTYQEIKVDKPYQNDYDKYLDSKSFKVIMTHKVIF